MNHFKYDAVERRKIQNPEAVLTEIGLKAGHVLVDIGCGNGFFTIPAAKIVGESGRVLGIDMDPSAITHLKREAQKEGLKNIELKIGRAEATMFSDANADFAFFGIDLHDFSEISKVLINAKRMLKPDGVLIDIDWKKEAMDFGPPLAKRYSKDRAAQIIRMAGFKTEIIKDIGPFFYLIKAKK